MIHRDSVSLAKIHFAVLLFGMTGVFGKLLTVSPEIIVFGRTFIASIFLLLVMNVRKICFKLKNTADVFGMVVMGALLAIHWMTFFYSVQLSTVAIALLSISTCPIFVTFIEPIVDQKKIRAIDVLVSAFVFLGILLIVPEFELSNRYTQGVVVGVFSGMILAVIPIMSRRYLNAYSPMTICMYQVSMACLISLPIAGKAIFQLTFEQVLYLVLLGSIFTAIANTLFIYGMKNIKAQLATVINCLEPVYGTALAFIILNEIPTGKVFTGGVIIITTIILATKVRARETGIS